MQPANKKIIDQNDEIRQQLSHLLGIEFSRTYPPLDDKSFFKPHVEKSYQNLVIFRDLQNCYQTYRDVIRFPHQYLLSSKENLENIFAVIQSIINYRMEGRISQ